MQGLNLNFAGLNFDFLEEGVRMSLLQKSSGLLWHRSCSGVVGCRRH